MSLGPESSCTMGFRFTSHPLLLHLRVYDTTSSLTATAVWTVGTKQGFNDDPRLSRSPRHAPRATRLVTLASASGITPPNLAGAGGSVALCARLVLFLAIGTIVVRPVTLTTSFASRRPPPPSASLSAPDTPAGGDKWDGDVLRPCYSVSYPRLSATAHAPIQTLQISLYNNGEKTTRSTKSAINISTRN